MSSPAAVNAAIRATAESLVTELNRRYGYAELATLETDDAGSTWYVRVARHCPATRDDIVVGVTVEVPAGPVRDIADHGVPGPVFAIEPFVLHQWAMHGVPFARCRAMGVFDAAAIIGYYVPAPGSTRDPAYAPPSPVTRVPPAPSGPSAPSAPGGGGG